MNEFFLFVKNNIELKAKIDKLQLDILEYLTDNELKMIDGLLEKHPCSRDLCAQFRLQFLMNRAFDHSTDEDKILTYKLITNDREADREFKKLGISLPQYIKIRDYSYLLERSRREYRFSKESLINFMSAITKIEEENYFKELNEKQYKYNKQITILTYVVVLLTIITLCTGVISSYYSIIDHRRPTVQKKNNIQAVVYSNAQNL